MNKPDPERRAEAARLFRFSLRGFAAALCVAAIAGVVNGETAAAGLLVVMAFLLVLASARLK